MNAALFRVSAPALNPAGWWTCAYIRDGLPSAEGTASESTANAARVAAMVSVREYMLCEAGLPT